MSNLTVNELILAQANWAPVHWTFVAIEIFILVACVPFLYRDRQVAKIHFRCWTLYSMTAVFLLMIKISTAIYKTPGWANDTNYTLLRIIDLAGLVTLFPSYHAIFLRQWFLMQRPKIQQLLATIPVNDVAQYTALTKKLQRIRFLSSTAGTWLTWFVHSFLLAIVVAVPMYLYWDMKADLLVDFRNMFVFINFIVVLAEPISAIILLFVVIPFKSADNFNIGPQLRLATYATGANVIISAVCSFIGGSIFHSVDAWNTALVPCIIEGIFLIIPVIPDRYLWSNTLRLDRATSQTNSSRNLVDGKSQASTQHMTSSIGHLNTKTRQRTELEEILANPSKLKDFKAFMAKEFCLENILFCIAMDSYRIKVKESKDHATRLALAKAIFVEYIVPGSPNELNLVSNEVKFIKEKLKQLEVESGESAIIFAELYDHADTHVRELIEKNNLLRYHRLK